MKAFRISSIITCSIVALTLIAAATAASADTFKITTSGTLGDGVSTLDLVDVQLNGSGVVTSIGAGSYIELKGIDYSVVSLLTGQTYAEEYNAGSSGPGTGTPGGYDQKLSSTSPYLDAYGLALIVNGSPAGATQNDEIQIWLTPNGLLHVADESYDPTDSFNVSTYSKPGTSLVLTPTPEPDTLLLFGTGLLGLAGLVRRRLNQSR